MLQDEISANSEAIRKIDTEIAMLQDDKVKADKEKEDKKLENKKKKCKYFNAGHCKYKMECKFSHPSQVCEIYLEGGKCVQKLCGKRHPKICKWSQGKSVCKQLNCDYLHVTPVRDDEQHVEAHKYFPCAGCKSIFPDISYVVQQQVNDVGFNLCLNCEGWIKDKEMVLMSGWTIFDRNGYLRTDV